jgi:hypothetical protein
MKTVNVIIEKRIPDELTTLFQCVGFWNEQGKDLYEMNKQGKMGSKRTQELARSMSYHDFILDMLISDIEIVHDNPKKWPVGYIYGRSGSHIWVSDSQNARVLLIHL